MCRKYNKSAFHASANLYIGKDMYFHTRIATKKATDKVQQWSQECWLDMGVCTLTLFAYKREDGKYAVDM